MLEGALRLRDQNMGLPVRNALATGPFLIISSARYFFGMCLDRHFETICRSPSCSTKIIPAGLPKALRQKFLTMSATDLNVYARLRLTTSSCKDVAQSLA